ncbi:MAG: hypothetical protein AABW54_01555 [Candidatus Micrarchaeota archaeon]
MNLRVFATVLAVLTAGALAAYGFGPALEQSSGWIGFFASFWRLEAIALAASIAASFAWPHVRGLRKGDKAVAVVTRTRHAAGGRLAECFTVPVVLLDAGRKGSRVAAAMPDGTVEYAVVSSYGGVFSAATVMVSDAELKVSKVD